MKKFLFIALLFCVTQTKAQYVTIPDTAFVSYLKSIVPTAMNGNQMDTTSAAVTGLTGIGIEYDSISNLTGVQYFDSLTSLDCSYNNLTNLPKLPHLLTYLNCDVNKLTSLPILPTSLVFLQCYNNLLPSLPTLPNTIKQIDCSYNNLTSLPTLPDSLKQLFCTYNQLTSLPALPNKLYYLYCYNNQLTSLPALPNLLQELKCNNNQLISLPVLPNLTLLWCNNNNISCFPPFPDSLAYSASGISCPACAVDPLIFSNNPFNCVPNYVSVMDSVQHSYPLCSAGNSNGCAVAGIKQITNSSYQVKVYPNPNNGNFTIETSTTEKQIIEIFDVTGKMVLNQNINGNTTIDASNLNAGVYNININGTANKRLVIVR